MRIATIQTSSGPHAAVLDGEYYVDLPASDPALPRSVRELLAAGDKGLREAERVCRTAAAVRYQCDGVHLLPPIVDPPKIICLGLNYRDHAAETGAKLPSDPIL